jgi:hypothetical protein
VVGCSSFGEVAYYTVVVLDLKAVVVVAEQIGVVQGYWAEAQPTGQEERGLDQAGGLLFVGHYCTGY